jgi:hypothetical protein
MNLFSRARNPASCIAGVCITREGKRLCQVACVLSVHNGALRETLESCKL